MLNFIKGILKFFIYSVLILNIFIATSANVFSDNISENNSRYVLSMLLLFVFYIRKYIYKIPKFLFNKILKKT